MWGPDIDADEILRRTERVWELHSDAWFGPVPRVYETPPASIEAAIWCIVSVRNDETWSFVSCPVCKAHYGALHIQHWRYHKKDGPSRVPYRCDVGFKCTMCAAVWIHGVALPEWYWDAMAQAVGRRVYWREAERLAI